MIKMLAVVSVMFWLPANVLCAFFSRHCCCSVQLFVPCRSSYGTLFNCRHVQSSVLNAVRKTTFWSLPWDTSPSDTFEETFLLTAVLHTFSHMNCRFVNSNVTPYLAPYLYHCVFFVVDDIWVEPTQCAGCNSSPVCSVILHVTEYGSVNISDSFANLTWVVKYNVCLATRINRLFRGGLQLLQP